ncbi:MAG: hypothetical protein FJY81_07535 [Candidatus Aminicenantes bacterium]|nr:hypothetical protein [Candidatus Aminicenantes bacterium]
MERRDFLKTLLATSLASPLLSAAKALPAATSLYLISDRPESFLPTILKEIAPRPWPQRQAFSLDASHPSAEPLRRALCRAGWVFASPASAPAMSLSFRVLNSPALPSFTLVRQGRIQDIRTSALFRLWERMTSSASPSSLLTTASFPTPPGRRGRRVTVYADGKPAASFPLDKDQVKPVRTLSGWVVVGIESGCAKVVSSTCRHQVCLASPPIAYAGERIICAPRHFLLEIEGPRLVDMVTG